MSDNGLTTDSAPTFNSQPEPAPAATPPATAQPAGAPDDPLAPPPDDQAVFTRGYVDRIRTEAAKYRDQAKQYTDVYGDYEPEDVEAWFDLARAWRQDPMMSAAMMREVANSMLGPETPAAPPAETLPPPTLDDAVKEIQGQLSPDQVQTMINETLGARERSAAEQRAINEIYAEVRAAGYDPEGDGFQILYDANHYTGGDIPKAIEMQRAREQKIIDDYVAGRASGVRPMPSPIGGMAGQAAPPLIANIEDAKKATDAFLKERRTAT